MDEELTQNEDNEQCATAELVESEADGEENHQNGEVHDPNRLPSDGVDGCDGGPVARNSLTELNSRVGHPGGDITRQENVRLSNDTSLGVVRPIRLVAFGCSTLYLVASSGLSSSSLIRPVIYSTPTAALGS